jgi:tetratricopeptide (TPR) repeat protein
MGKVGKPGKRQAKALREGRKDVALGVAPRDVTEERLGGSRGSATAARPTFSSKDWSIAAALVIAIFVTYYPAWNGGPLWDDNNHMTRAELQSLHGLGRIWFESRATLQYYPFVHSVFWIEHLIFGDATLGYHLVNIALHAASALMVAMLLRRLAIPGAWLAAAVFALHPLQVETVAWITELKNTLSMVLYLAAALVYLRFDRTREPVWYLTALGLFVLALLTKTVTGTLPGALLVVIWWQRGKLSWTKDVLPLAPWFVLGAALGIMTAVWELQVNKCVGPAFQFTWIERLLIANRAAWFYLGKLVWPTNLTFIYPRWQIDSHATWQYIFPFATACLLAAAWACRRLARGPLAALLFFGGTLVPVLGFFNLYTFIYSFVADHYQYVACLGIITLVSAGIALLLARVGDLTKAIGQAACLALVTVLAVLSWRQCRMYTDMETLWRTTIQRNPTCWLAEHNLGVTLAHLNKVDEAMPHYRRALEIKPDYDIGHSNLGLALAVHGDLDEAMAEYQRALDINPEYEQAHNYLGLALAKRGRFVEAVKQYRKAIEIKPEYAEARANLGRAVDDFQKAVATTPDNAAAQFQLAKLLAELGHDGDAMAHYEKALAVEPDFLEAHYNLGILLAGQKKLAAALVHYREALRLASQRNDAGLVEMIRNQIRIAQPTAAGVKSP